jgi:hypothetical protein
LLASQIRMTEVDTPVKAGPSSFFRGGSKGLPFEHNRISQE